MRRWLAFNAVGTMGVAVQLTVLLSLTEALGLNYLVATVLAVESAILHNFVWHERWTWRDRDTGIHGRWTRLAWFNLVTGALSISTNVVFTALYVSTLGIHYAMANLMAIATCSLLTFVASDRFVSAHASEPAITVRYGTEHRVRYTRHRPGAASSRSVSTRIVEPADAGSTAEREKPIGRDRAGRHARQPVPTGNRRRNRGGRNRNRRYVKQKGRRIGIEQEAGT